MEAKKNTTKTNRTLFRMLSFFISVILTVATLVAAGFGFASSVQNKGSIDNVINPTLSISSKVKLGKNTNISDVAKSISSTLDFLGKNNTNVYTIGNESIKVELPISSYGTSEKLIDSMTNINSNSEYQKNLEEVIVSTFLSGNLDLRTTKGDELFAKNYNGYYEFQEPKPADPSGDKSLDFSDVDWAPELFDKSKVAMKNGVSEIDVKIKDKNINQFKKWNNWFNGNAGSENSQYVVWIEYDLLDKIASSIDSDYKHETGLYATYIQGKEYSEIPRWIKPFYISDSKSAPMKNIYSNKLVIKNNKYLDSNKAKYFSKVINNSNSYSFENMSFDFSMNKKSSVMLIVLAIVLLLFILGIIFTFLWYFGLLGLIGSMIYLLTMTFLALLLSSFGIIITGIGLLTMIVSSVISAIFFYLVLKVYKNNNEDKFMTYFKRFSNKFTAFNKITFAPTISFILIIYFSTLLISSLMASILFILIIGVTLSYLMSIIILFPIILGFDFLTRFTFEEKTNKTNKWNLIIGFDKKINNEKSLIKVNNIEKKTLVISIVAVLTAVFTILLSSILFITTGSSNNSNLYGTRNYEYSVVLSDETKQILMTSDNPAENPDTNVMNLKNEFNEYNTKKGDIKSAFENSGIKVNSMETIRNDYLKSKEINSNDNFELYSSFGTNIYSSEAMSLESLDEINVKLNSLGYKVIVSNSLIDENGNVEKLVNHTNNDSLIKSILSILIIIALASFIALLLGGWGISLSTLISILMESIFIISPLFIIFTPYTVFIWIPIIIMLSLSVLLKISTFQKVKNDENKENSWLRNSKSGTVLLLIIGVIMAIISLLLIPLYGVAVSMSLFVVSIWSPFVIFIIQRIIFPYFANLLGDFRNKIKSNKIKDDVRRAKNNDEVSEEFIEGINM